ncbi:hypothetical protein GB937_007185 [Aspergillus fischeri]|nr:hypothetical protein GB937_007185 [Aspergillus fischeri]
MLVRLPSRPHHDYIESRGRAPWQNNGTFSRQTTRSTYAPPSAKQLKCSEALGNSGKHNVLYSPETQASWDIQRLRPTVCHLGAAFTPIWIRYTYPVSTFHKDCSPRKGPPIQAAETDDDNNTVKRDAFGSG